MSELVFGDMCLIAINGTVYISISGKRMTVKHGLQTTLKAISVSCHRTYLNYSLHLFDLVFIGILSQNLNFLKYY